MKKVTIKGQEIKQEYKRMTMKDIKQRQQEIKQEYESLLIEDVINIKQEIMESYDTFFGILDGIVKYVEQQDSLTQETYDTYWDLLSKAIKLGIEENGGADKMFNKKLLRAKCISMANDKAEEFVMDLYNSGYSKKQRMGIIGRLQCTIENRTNELKSMGVREIAEEVVSVVNYYESLLHKYEYKVQKDIQQDIEEVQEQEFIFRTRKITDRQELLDLAQDNGYSFKRQTGSHMILENDTGKVVVVPIHAEDIGKGLSCKIQKDIHRNK